MKIVIREDREDREDRSNNNNLDNSNSFDLNSYNVYKKYSCKHKLDLKYYTINDIYNRYNKKD